MDLLTMWEGDSIRTIQKVIFIIKYNTSLYV
jgi:hypothetical protein